MQKVVGSEFEVKTDCDSAGIQAIDVVLWLYLQHARGNEFPRECARLMNYAFKHAFMSDFSFDGVMQAVERQFGQILRQDLSDDQEADARKLIELGERRRQESMARYKRDGIVPFMRSLMAEDESKTIEDEAAPAIADN
jgi:hypothetical protein